jgi:autotransporter-associated beta strand protein
VNLGTRTLTISGGSQTFGGVIQGSGGNLVLASGNESLTGTNSYTGTTTINGGTLTVNGSIASSLLTTVNTGGTLTGTGTVGNVTVNGGTFAPGPAGAPGTMSVSGSLTFTAAATYLVQVTPATSSSAVVTGAATLGGASVNAQFAAGTYVAKQYTIVSAGSVSGTFNPTVVTNGLPAGFNTSLSYDGTHAYLNLALNFAPPSGSLNGNQQKVGNAIINFFNSNGSIAAVFGGLTPAGLTQLSGEVGSAPQQTTFNAMTQFMGMMTDPFVAGRGDPVSAGGAPNAYADESLAYAARRARRSGGERDAYAAMSTKAGVAPSVEQRWSVWAAGFGGSQATDGNTVVGSNNTTSNLYGTAVGADYRISRDTLVGFALAGGGTNFTVANALGGGRSDLFQAGAFFRHNAGPAYITGALAYGWQDIVTDRTVTVAGLDRLRAEFNANAWSGRLEGGYRFVNQGFGWTPYVAAQATTFDLPAYAEQAIVGSNQFALAYNAKSVTDTRTELGLRTDKSFAQADAIVTLRGRLAWAHDFNPDRSLLATFQTLPGASFVASGAKQAADSALTTASAEWKWLNGWSAAATFEGEFSNVTRSYAGKAAVRYAW